MSENMHADDQLGRPNRLTEISTLFPFSLAVLMLVTSVGCGGGSNSAENDVVSPPERTATDEGASSDSSASSADPSAADSNTTAPQPPGGLELPSDADPGQSSETPASKSGGLELPSDADLSTEPPAEAGASTTSPVEYGTWDEIQTVATGSGQITVVDLWSLACEPCLKEFPGLVRLHKEHGESVQCVAVDMDYDGRKSRPPEYYAERVQSFVQSVGAEFTTYISRTPSDEIYSATELDSIPAVLIYGKDGKLVKVFSDSGESVGFTYDKDVIPLVEELVRS